MSVAIGLVARGVVAVTVGASEAKRAATAQDGVFVSTADGQDTKH
jgi:hypothetical protein